jgi:hypothetical protein
MLVVTGNKRTADECTALLHTTGFRFIGVIPTAGPVSIVEAEAA